MAKGKCKNCKHFSYINADVSPSVFDGVCMNKQGKKSITLDKEQHTMFSFGYAYSGGHCDNFEKGGA